MKRKIFALLALLMITFMLTSCEFEGYPKIREERFDFSVTYEEWGEQKTISGVYVCKFAGYDFTLEGGDFVRSWEGHIEGIEGAGDEYNSAVLIRETDDGGEIYLDFSLVASRMMGEPYLESAVPEPAFFLVYSNEDHTSSEFGGDEKDIEERYGLKIVGYQYDAPIENSFGLFG